MPGAAREEPHFPKVSSRVPVIQTCSTECSLFVSVERVDSETYDSAC